MSKATLFFFLFLVIYSGFSGVVWDGWGLDGWPGVDGWDGYRETKQCREEWSALFVLSLLMND